MLKRGRLCKFCIKIHIKGWLLGDFPYIHSMLYAKMFHGYDKMKHFETWCEACYHAESIITGSSN